MNGLRGTTAISLDQDRLVAVGGSASSGRVKIKGWTSAQMPAGVDPRDAKKVGEWVRAELDKAGLGGGKLVIAVPRGDVVLKKLKLPRAEGAGEAELAGMVRLQMARQLTMAIEGTAIDYVAIEEAEKGPTISVLAGALPADKMTWYQDMAASAGLSIERVGLRASGAAAALAAVSQRHNGPVLGVAIGWSSIEFLVVKDGQLVFARAADVGLTSATGAIATTDDADSALGQKIAVEAKRTWMSYRVGDEATTVEAVVVPGDGPLARDVGEACGKALEMPWELAALPASVELPSEMSEADRLVAAPLIGLIGEEVLARRSLDFANPRKPPDLAAAKRQRVLVAMLGLIVIGGGGYVYSGWKVHQVERKVTEARERNKSLREQYTSYLKDHARLSHIQKWTGAGFDWLAHASWLSDQMPDPRQAQLDLLSGDSRIVIAMTPLDGRYDPNGWQIGQAAQFSIQGKAKQREVSNELRKTLVSSPVYQVETKGADLPDRFAMELTTDAASPDEAIARATQPKAIAKPAPTKPDAKGDPKATPPAKPPEAKAPESKAAPKNPPKPEKGGGG